MTEHPKAKTWCEAQGAKLVSIYTMEENAFVRGICGAVSCWLGVTEKEGTGDKTTPPSKQQWIWDDGNDVTYSNWKKWPMPFTEPNNFGDKGTSPMVVDERLAYMNSGENGANFEGYWYDALAGHQAKALCKMPLGQAPGTPPHSPCAAGWTDFEGKCYTGDPEKKDWHSAEAWCKSKDADLVSINGEPENGMVRKVCGMRMCWIGLSEVVGTGDGSTPQASQQWVWNDGTTPTAYANWKQWGAGYTEPNNWLGDKPMSGDERKAFINYPLAGAKGFWYDAVATLPAHGICEKPMTP